MSTMTEMPVSERAEAWGEKYLTRLTEATRTRLDALAEDAERVTAAGDGGRVARLGEPGGAYVAFDVAMTSPLQFFGDPPFAPSKVIAAGEQAFIYAYIFVNPVVNVPLGWRIPPSTQLGGRTWRLTLDQVNLSDPTQLVPRQVKSLTFSAPPVPMLTYARFALDTPDPGSDPALIEANVTLDILDAGQPFAAFATSFFDYDDDPGFLFVPPARAGWRNQIPNRYLVYRR